MIRLQYVKHALNMLFKRTKNTGLSELLKKIL